MTAAENRRRLAVARASSPKVAATQPSPRPKATAEQIAERRNRAESLMAAVAAQQGYTLSELRAKDRRPALVKARGAVMLAARRADFPLEDIGHVLHRHYTSVLHGVRRLEQEAAR